MIKKRFDWSDQSDLGGMLCEQQAWLVTGAAGFIGSNIVEALLLSNQKVRGLDNFATGSRRNLEMIAESVGPELMRNFEFISADICEYEACTNAVEGQDYILHNAAIGSVPRSIANPIYTHDSNVTGFLNMLDAARKAEVKRFVYAASSSTYGDHTALPKKEEVTGSPLSPYAATKLFNEIYADVFGRTYGLRTTGLRYFNVFGPRQDPNGAYAAVIPRWVAAMISDEPLQIFGDGETSRDFCYVDNAVQANLRAALFSSGDRNTVYNVAVGDRTSLNDLFNMLKFELNKYQKPYKQEPLYMDFRPGDVKHSQADIAKASSEIGYQPTHKFAQGLSDALSWYMSNAESG